MFFSAKGFVEKNKRKGEETLHLISVPLQKWWLWNPGLC
jgi:hypothetical protein